MIRRPPRSKRPDNLFPYTTLFRSIHWLLGGVAKSDDLDDCAPHFGNVATAYTIGEAGPRFAEILRPLMPVDDSELLITAVGHAAQAARPGDRSEEHTSELQSLMRISYAVLCLKKKQKHTHIMQATHHYSDHHIFIPI